MRSNETGSLPSTSLGMAMGPATRRVDVARVCAVQMLRAVLAGRPEVG